MRRVTISRLRGDLAQLLHEGEPVIVTRYGRAVAILYPIASAAELPMEIRRELLRDSTAEGAGSLDSVGATTRRRPRGNDK